MEQTAIKELDLLFREAIRAGGAALEMRARRFVSLVRATDPMLAETLTAAVTTTVMRRASEAASPPPVDRDSRLQLLRETYPVVLERPPILAPSSRAAIDRLLAERRAAERLLAEDLQPMRSLLLSGPPGVGKSMTAAWVAAQLNVPLLTLDLASVMSSYLGRTGSNVKAVLDHAQDRPCVLLLDEFDAIAKRRNDESDVGELKRLVTVLLQSIDDWSSTSVLIAATNHGELLDPAVWRRFDLTVELGLPSRGERCDLLVAHGIEPRLAELVAGCTEGMSQAVLHRAALNARKAPLVTGVPVANALLLWAMASLGGTARSRERTERDLRICLKHFTGRSSRDIATELNISHSTVNRTLSALKGVTDG